MLYLRYTPAVTTSNRARNKRGSGERLRDTLINAVADLLDNGHDVESLSVRTVTAAAGVSATALYLHFVDLPELVQATKACLFAELNRRLVSAAEPYPNDVRRRLRAMSRAYLDYAKDHPGHYSTIFHVDKQSTSSPSNNVLRAGFDAFQPLVNAVAEALTGEQHEQVADDVVFEIACELWLALHGRAHLGAAMPWFGLPDEDRYVDRLVRHVLPTERSSQQE